MTGRDGLGSRSTQYNLFSCRPLGLSAHMKAATDDWTVAGFMTVMLTGNKACAVRQDPSVWQAELLHLVPSTTV